MLSGHGLLVSIATVSNVASSYVTYVVISQ